MNAHAGLDPRQLCANATHETRTSLGYNGNCFSIVPSAIFRRVKNNLLGSTHNAKVF